MRGCLAAVLARSSPNSDVVKSRLEKAPAYTPVGEKHVLADPVVFSLDPFTDVSYFGNILFPSYKINEYILDQQRRLLKFCLPESSQAYGIRTLNKDFLKVGLFRLCAQ
ncbi:hypothetical protein NDU88_006412 [Pleurodeles waltl]|uniref:Uncharacterized protein n=1 Tax=Pleurodeles waltl TaxID=8319 RepID=A0AAV7VPR1_PLEWA|nr:hypothetical protein NDU88_006412 [Pleurodeles waltl]